MKYYLALDLGAESGRAMLGKYGGGVLHCEEVHRFANEPLRTRGGLAWDFPRLLHGVLDGIRAASARTGGRLHGISVDSWGVDFGLLDGRGELLANPAHYRDPRTRGVMKRVHEQLPREKIYEITGIQFLELNTIYQLAALQATEPSLLGRARTLLPMADLMHFFLCRRARAERTLASTTQLLDAHRRDWSATLIDALDLPSRIFPEVVASGTPLGPLDRSIASDAGLASPPPIIAGASHDTAAAVAAVPAVEDGDWAYLSSGTWSLLGVELDRPRISPEALAHNFTNEAGVGDTVRFLRNINGLWLIQECRRQWAAEGEELDYAELARLAEAAGPAAATIDPNAPQFLEGGDVPRRIRDACRSSGQAVPRSRGEVIRCALESLAGTYADVLRAVEAIVGRRLRRLHIVGGGSRHRLLNRLTAAALGIPVVAGPVEATAMGNLLIQALASGDVASVEEIRDVVAASCSLETFDP